MIRVLGRDTSVNVQKVMWLAEEIGLPVSREDFGGAFGGTDRPDYRRLNPNGTVPTLVDGDVVLWESNAILRYLSDRYGTAPWRPCSAVARGQAGQWMDWGLSCLAPPMSLVFRQLVRTPPEARDVTALNAAAGQAASHWGMLDRHLSQAPYVLGARPGLADIALGGMVYRWHALALDRPDLPDLQRWYHRLAARPAFRHHVMRPLS